MAVSLILLGHLVHEVDVPEVVAGPALVLHLEYVLYARDHINNRPLPSRPPYTHILLRCVRYHIISKSDGHVRNRYKRGILLCKCVKVKIKSGHLKTFPSPTQRSVTPSA